MCIMRISGVTPEVAPAVSWYTLGHCFGARNFQLQSSSKSHDTHLDTFWNLMIQISWYKSGTVLRTKGIRSNFGVTPEVAPAVSWYTFGHFLGARKFQLQNCSKSHDTHLGTFLDLENFSSKVAPNLMIHIWKFSEILMIQIYISEFQHLVLSQHNPLFVVHLSSRDGNVHFLEYHWWLLPT